MAQGDLYKIGRLVDNDTFRIRVRAAMLVYSQTQLTSSSAEAKNLAIWVLLNPQTDEMSMVSLVAADTTVLGATTVTDDVADHSGVQDTAIQARVNAQWATVAKKYPTSPLA
jgi:hypothetical protein